MKQFLFPSFEEWKASEYEYDTQIGDYHCRVARTSSYCGTSPANTYMLAISLSDNPCNMWVQKVFWESKTVTLAQDGILKDWYEQVCQTANEAWLQYIRCQYFDWTDTEILGQQVFLPRTVFELGTLKSGVVREVWKVTNDVTGETEKQYLVELDGKKFVAFDYELALDYQEAVRAVKQLRQFQVYTLQNQLQKWNTCPVK